MKRVLSFLLIFIICICVGLNMNAAEKFMSIKPNFDSIRTETQNPNSKYYFPTLMKMYRSNDTIMNLEQYRHLYYGYSFQEDYNPYRKSEFSDVIEPLYFKKKHTNAECDTIMKYAELSLEDNPFDLRQMTFYIIALKEKKKNARASIWQYRLKHLIAAIMSSGAGTQEKPWSVISPSNEYALLNFMNHVVKGHETVGESIDKLLIEPQSSKTPSEFYFDVSRVIDGYDRKFIDKTLKK